MIVWGHHYLYSNSWSVYLLEQRIWLHSTFWYPFSPQIFFLAQLVPLYIFIRVTTNIHMTVSILGSFEISSANGTNLKHFTLASGRLFGQGQKADTSFTKIPQEWFLGNNTKILWNLLRSPLTVRFYERLLVKVQHSFIQSHSPPLPSMFLLGWLSKQHLMHSTAFLIHSSVLFQTRTWSGPMTAILHSRYQLLG